MLVFNFSCNQVILRQSSCTLQPGGLIFCMCVKFVSAAVAICCATKTNTVGIVIVLVVQVTILESLLDATYFELGWQFEFASQINNEQYCSQRNKETDKFYQVANTLDCDIRFRDVILMLDSDNYDNLLFVRILPLQEA